MRIKRYVARTIQEALDTVREDLGPDAVILHTRKARRGKLAGLLGGERFEVIAALDVNVPEMGGHPRTSRASAGTAAAWLGTRQGTGTGAAARAYALAAARQNDEGLANRAEEDGSARGGGDPQAGEDSIGAIEGPARSSARPGLEPAVAVQATRAGVAVAAAGAGRAYESTPAARLVEMHERLLDMDVDPDLAEALIQAAKMKWREAQVAGKSPYELVQDLVTATLPVAGGVALASGSRKVVALVGPTGVGKTTTLAKIAALTALFGKKKVAFVTADTYRIAAVEQLRTYAEIIGVPCEVVYTPAEMRQALAAREECDLVLIDTAGRSPRSGMHMAELRAFLEAAQVDETHLVLSMTTRPRDLLDIVERFSPCGVNRLIFSKLDETSRLGPILGVTSAVKVPISYVTYGQNVPEDIEVADPFRLARWILGGGVDDPAADGESAEKTAVKTDGGDRLKGTGGR